MYYLEWTGEAIKIQIILATISIACICLTMTYYSKSLHTMIEYRILGFSIQSWFSTPSWLSMIPKRKEKDCNE